MIEGLGIAVAAGIGLVTLIWFVGHAIAKHDAAKNLEEYIARGALYDDEVRALLLTRGHLLRPEVRDAAKVWLLERENEAAEKKG